MRKSPSRNAGSAGRCHKHVGRRDRCPFVPTAPTGVTRTSSAERFSIVMGTMKSGPIATLFKRMSTTSAVRGRRNPLRIHKARKTCFILIKRVGYTPNIPFSRGLRAALTLNNPDRLERRLRHPTPSVRVRALSSLNSTDSRDLDRFSWCPVLTAALLRLRQVAPSAAAEELATTDPLPWAARVLAGSLASRYSTAARDGIIHGNIRMAPAEDILLAHVTDRRPALRRRAAQILLDLAHQPLLPLPTLRALLRDSVPAVRAFGSTVLRAWARALLGELEHALHDTASAKNAAHALGSLMDGLAGLLDLTHAPLWAKCTRLFGRSFAMAERFLRDPDERRREIAVGALLDAPLPLDHLLPTIEALLNQRDSAARGAGASLLGKVGRDFQSLYDKALADPSPLVRQRAALSIRCRSDLPQPIEERLLGLLRDRRVCVALAAAVGLAGFGHRGEPIRRIFLRALRRRGEDLYLALEGLASFREEAMFALARLRELLRSRDINVIIRVNMVAEKAGSAARPLLPGLRRAGRRAPPSVKKWISATIQSITSA